MRNDFEEMMAQVEAASWFAGLAELEEAFTEAGFDVLEANSEYVVVAYEDDDEDVQVQVRLSGTESTIVIDSYEEVYRG